MFLSIFSLFFSSTDSTWILFMQTSITGIDLIPYLPSQSPNSMEMTMTMIHSATNRSEERHHNIVTPHSNSSRNKLGNNEPFGLIEWTTYHLVAICIVMVLFIATLFGSTLVIISIMKFKRLQIPSNYIILNMAISDICVATVMPLILVIELVGGYFHNVYVCLLPYGLVTLASGVSLLSICIIAYDRYAALVKPLRYGERITPLKIGMLCAAAWIYVFAVSAAPFVGWYSVLQTSDFGFKCQYHVLNNYAILFQICSIFVPGLVVMVICYTRVMLVARRHTRAISAVQSSLFPNQASTSKRSYSLFKGSKYTRTLALILGSFLMTWGVFVTCLLIEIFCPSCTVPLHKYAGLLVFLKSSLNWWIYCYRSQDFKAAFRRLLRTVFPCLKKKKRSSGVQMLDGRQGSTSRASEALSRTNSMVGGINQQLEILYENEVMETPQQPTEPINNNTRRNIKMIEHDNAIPTISA